MKSSTIKRIIYFKLPDYQGHKVLKRMAICIYQYSQKGFYSEEDLIRSGFRRDQIRKFSKMAENIAYANKSPSNLK